LDAAYIYSSLRFTPPSAHAFTQHGKHSPQPVNHTESEQNVPLGKMKRTRKMSPTPFTFSHCSHCSHAQHVALHLCCFCTWCLASTPRCCKAFLIHAACRRLSLVVHEWTGGLCIASPAVLESVSGLVVLPGILGHGYTCGELEYHHRHESRTEAGKRRLGTLRTLASSTWGMRQLAVVLWCTR
jgi:hypothetical protein